LLKSKGAHETVRRLCYEPDQKHESSPIWRSPAEDASFCDSGPAAVGGGLVAPCEAHVMVRGDQLGVTMEVS